MEETLNIIVRFLAQITEMCSALIVILGIGRAMIVYILRFLKRHDASVKTLRIQLGQSLVLGLEFQVAADVLKTTVSPTWEEFLFLAALIGLRTVLNFLIEYELRSLDGKKASPEPE